MAGERQPSVGAAQRALSGRLAAAGVASPGLDARLLVRLATGLALEDLIADPDRPLRPAEAARLAALERRRVAGEPVSRLAGEREFHGRRFAIDAATLDPRPETEALVETALAAARRRGGATGEGVRILDLGTGSGIVLVSLLAELAGASGVGIDLSPAALAVAQGNAERHGVASRARFAAGDWGAGLDGPFDLVVSNPPYIPSADIAGLAPEVRDHDPRLALDGGPDGLDAYRAIADEAPRLLAPGGTLAVEIGAGQEDQVEAILAAAGLSDPERVRDLAGRVRVIAMQRPAAA